MADIFASPKQPSLFPMIIPCPEISKEAYHDFYRYERRLFNFLLVALQREPVQSILVMAFLIWLEREGYTYKNLVQNILNSLLADGINRIADEVVICLKWMGTRGSNFMSAASSSGGSNISLLQEFLERKHINLMEIHDDRVQIFKEVSGIAKDLSGKAFEDILQEDSSRTCGPPAVPASPRPAATLGGRAGDYGYMGPVDGAGSGGASYDAPFMRNYVMAQHYRPTVALGGANPALIVPPMNDFRQHTNLGLNQLHGLRRAPSAGHVRDEEQVVPPDDRTIFLTFSKGYPISESEVIEYFTRMFGDFIEAIYMHETGPDEQPLYARIVAHSPSTVSAVIDRDGASGKSKYYINGKHVWARKFVKKKPARAGSC